MKIIVGLVVLAVACVALVIALTLTSKQAATLHKADVTNIGALSNQLVATSLNLDEQRQVNAALEKERDQKNQVLIEMTNNYTALSGELDKTSTSLKAAQQDVVQRDAKIADLELQNQALNQRADQLSTSITNLNTQITETQQKLATAEGDKSFLQKELQRLMTEKAALEKQFNDLTVLRAQVSKLKEELTVGRRLDWIRRGIFATSEKKGGELLLQSSKTPTFPTSSPAVAQSPSNQYDLNVEVYSDGSVHVIPPPTNTPAKSP
ncbi:MAG TPA: hypothetical protein VF437_10840 [Verrucomicrobiae bacterium]